MARIERAPGEQSTEPPGPFHTLQSVRAAVLELEVPSSSEAAGDLGHEELTGIGLGHHSGGDVDLPTSDVPTCPLHLAGVHSDPEPERTIGNGLAHVSAAYDCSSGTVEDR